jgi:hypothetical protein
MTSRGSSSTSAATTQITNASHAVLGSVMLSDVKKKKDLAQNSSLIHFCPK